MVKTPTLEELAKIEIPKKKKKIPKKTISGASLGWIKKPTPKKTKKTPKLGKSHVVDVADNLATKTKKSRDTYAVVYAGDFGFIYAKKADIDVETLKLLEKGKFGTDLIGSGLMVSKTKCAAPWAKLQTKVIVKKLNSTVYIPEQVMI